MSSLVESNNEDDGSLLKVYGDKLVYREAVSDHWTTYDYAGSFYVDRGDNHISHDAESGDITITCFEEAPNIPLSIPSTPVSNRLRGRRSNRNIPIDPSRLTAAQYIATIDLSSLSVPFSQRGADLVLRYKPSSDTSTSPRSPDVQPDMTLYVNNLEMGPHAFSLHKELSTLPGHNYNPRSSNSISGGSIGIGYICHDEYVNPMERMEVYKPNNPESVEEIKTAIGTFVMTLPERR
ncbi:hypothetical protein I204_03760 [Kwoniella mangroviensis CBS 8886]|nr:hypothetical protein I204_03760 [Kwoniella mangroviensis CBS 8886]